MRVCLCSCLLPHASRLLTLKHFIIFPLSSPQYFADPAHEQLLPTMPAEYQMPYTLLIEYDKVLVKQDWSVCAETKENALV